MSESEPAVITFPEGLPGFAHLRRFALVEHVELHPIALLTSLEDEHVRLPIVPVAAVVRDYRLQVDGADLALLGADAVDGLLCLAVLDPSRPGRPASCNLFAPIVVNPTTLRAKQVLQLGTDYPTEHVIGGEPCS